MSVRRVVELAGVFAVVGIAMVCFTPRGEGNAYAAQEPVVDAQPAPKCMYLFEYAELHDANLKGDGFAVYVRAGRIVKPHGIKRFIMLEYHHEGGVVVEGTPKYDAEWCREWVAAYERCEDLNPQQSGVVEAATLKFFSSTDVWLEWEPWDDGWKLRRKIGENGRHTMNFDPDTQLFPALRAALKDLEAMKDVPSIVPMQ